MTEDDVHNQPLLEDIFTNVALYLPSSCLLLIWHKGIIKSLWINSLDPLWCTFSVQAISHGFKNNTKHF